MRKSTIFSLKNKPSIGNYDALEIILRPLQVIVLFLVPARMHLAISRLSASSVVCIPHVRNNIIILMTKITRFKGVRLACIGCRDVDLPPGRMVLTNIQDRKQKYNLE